MEVDLTKVQQAPKDTSFGSFLQTAKGFSRPPESQWSHAHSLLNTQKAAVGQGSSMSDLKTPDAFLGFIESDEILRYYQLDIFWLHNLFQLARGTPELLPVFDVLYNNWIFEIRLTANKSGTERKMQYSFGAGVTGEGYGKMLQEMEERRQRDSYNAQKNNPVAQAGGGGY